MNQAQFGRTIDLGLVLRRGWVVVICAVIGAGAAFLHARNEPPRYTATAGLLFGDTSVLQVVGLSSATSSGATGVQATDQGLVGLPVILQMTQRALGSSAPTGGYSVGSTTSGSSNIVNVVATAHTPTGAARVANTYAQQFIDYEVSGQASQVQSAIRAIQASIASEPKSTAGDEQVAKLQGTLAGLQTISASKPLDVSIVQRAVAPGAPSGPRKSRDAVLGALIGALVGAIFAILIEMLDPRLHSPAFASESEIEVFDVERSKSGSNGLRRTALGLVRRAARPSHTDGAASRASAHCVFLSGPGERDSAVRTQLTRLTGFVAAESGMSVAVLRFDSGADDAGAEPSSEDLTDVAKSVAILESQSAGDTSGRVDVLVPRAQVFAQDDELWRLLDTLRGSYDLLLIDLSPADLSTATDALIAEAGAVVVIARLHASSRRAVALQLDRVTRMRDDSAILVTVDRRQSLQVPAQPAKLAERVG